jgi:hypothetical protein
MARLPWLLLLIAVALQVRSGILTLPGDLAQSDPPAHFTTGVMLHDFLEHPFVPPMPFAECFYIQYPKVAFGHWPPVFYVIEALWFFVFGVSILAAKWLCEGLAAVCALVLYRLCSRCWGAWYAGAFTAVFLAFPLVQGEAWRVMADMLLTLLVLLAMASFSDYVNGGKRKDAFWFAAWSVLAVLTKGTAWLLLIPFTAGPLLTLHRHVYSRLSYWLSIAGILALSLPFYLWMSSLHVGYPTGFAGQIVHLKTMLSNMTPVQRTIGVCLLMAATATIYWFRPRKPAQATSVLPVLFALWIVSQVVFIVLVPLTPEWDRYLMPALAAAAFLLAGSAAGLERRLAKIGFKHGKLLTALLCGVAIAPWLHVKLLYATTAYSQACSSIPLTRTPLVILVDSDAWGEGAVVAARLEQDRLRRSYVLRATRLLSDSDWSGREYSLKYEDTAAIRRVLDNNLVDYAVIDESVLAPSARLLEAALQDPAEKWELTKRIPVAMGRRSGELLVYRRAVPVGSGSVPSSVQLGPERDRMMLTCRAK